MVVVKIMKLGLVLVPNVDNSNLRVGKFCLGGVPSKNSNGMRGKKYGTGKKVVFMGTTRMSDNGMYHILTR